MELTPQIDPHFLALQEALAGKYSLEAEIGRGGMGIVYLAQEVQLDRPVALKVLPLELSRDESLRERFLREARMAAKLSHPNIIPIHAVDEAGDFVYFAMSYVVGSTLGQRVQERGPLPPSEGARILKEVAWALAYAHSQGVVHRDIKPDNILIEEGSGRALVADFGIAGLMEGTAATGVGEIIGTAEFMSPEQAGGAGVDARSDIYSMGIVGFFALSGTLPFQDENASEVLRQHIEETVAPLKTVAPHVPTRLARCVDRCVAKDPDSRFETAGFFAEAIDAANSERRELPVAVRNFINDPIDLPGDGVTYFATSLTVAATVGATVFTFSGDMAMVRAVMAAFGGIVLGPAGVLVIQRIRRLLASGHSKEDLLAALRTELERRREELAYTHGVEPSKVEMGAHRAAAAAAGAFLMSFWGMMDLLPGSGSLWAILFLGSGAASVGLESIAAMLRARRVDHKAERRFKFWKGEFADWLFKVAGAGLKRKALPVRPTHRATELQIGFAVDGLYEQLPREIQTQLGDVTSVARHLEADAQTLRQTLEKLNEAQAAARATGGQIPLDLVNARNQTETRLAEAVASLESIRLGLLRLTAGAGTVESLTTDLAAATTVGDDIDRLMAGMTDVELLLRPT